MTNTPPGLLGKAYAPTISAIALIIVIAAMLLSGAVSLQGFLGFVGIVIGLSLVVAAFGKAVGG